MKYLRRLLLGCALTALVVSAVMMRIPGIQGSISAPVQGLDPSHDCSFCHDLHGGVGFALNTQATIEATCLACHNGGDPLAPVVTIHENKPGSSYAPFAMSCADCHSPHNDRDTDNEDGGKNLRLINGTIATPASGDRAVVFENLQGPSNGTMADGDTLDLDGVCEVCHTQTLNHRGILPGTASNHSHGPAKARCTGCHPHDDKFAPAFGRCTTCHRNGTNGAPQVVTQFERASHHIAWESFASPNNVADSIPDSDCTTCHNPLHDGQTGNIRFRNFDTGGDIQLAGDPFTNAAAKDSVTVLCLSCHDPAGNASATPFSDGVIRPTVDSTAFVASSHSTGGQECLDCHATGHGSEKRKLLATTALPASAAPDSGSGSADLLYFEEEGFCFDCHRSGGAAASFDIESQFATPIRWVTAPAGLNNNVALNDRHDVQFAAQDSSKAKIECVNCHDPHTATHAQPWKTDPDPNDDRVPGTGQVLPGGDAMSEFCLDCHDGNIPIAPGVVDHQVAPLVNVRDHWLNDDAMGAAAGTNRKDLRPTSEIGWTGDGTEMLPCNTCHNPHPTSVNRNLFSLVDSTRHKTTGQALKYIWLSNRGDTLVNTFDYKVILNDVGTDDLLQGMGWCNTCHRRDMRGRDNCFSCHRHGDGRF